MCLLRLRWPTSNKGDPTNTAYWIAALFIIFVLTYRLVGNTRFWGSSQRLASNEAESRRDSVSFPYIHKIEKQIQSQAYNVTKDARKPYIHIKNKRMSGIAACANTYLLHGALTRTGAMFINFQDLVRNTSNECTEIR